MDSTNLEQLNQHFCSKVQNIKDCLALRDASKEKNCASLLTTLNSDISSVEVMIALMKTELQQRKEDFKRSVELQSRVIDLTKKIQHAEQNLPVHLPRKQPLVETTNTRQTYTAPPGEASQHYNSGGRENQHSAVSAADCRKPTRPIFPTIEYIRVEEFESVPKYMKGRSSYDQVNTIIDELNKCFASKYTFLHEGRRSKKDSIRDRCAKYKSQHTKDTKGLFFIVESDIKELSTLKMTNVTRSMITILRHCGRLREIRGGGLVRYATCQ